MNDLELRKSREADEQRVLAEDSKRAVDSFDASALMRKHARENKPS